MEHEWKIVYILLGVLFSCLIAITALFFIYIPSIISQQREEQLPGLVKQALTEYFAENAIEIVQ